MNKHMLLTKSVRFLHICKHIVLMQLKLDFHGDDIKNFEIDIIPAVALI